MHPFQPPPSHIPQPPHTAGQGSKGLRVRVDPGQVPSPLESQQFDQREWQDRTFLTLPSADIKATFPLSTTDYVSLDQGNSAPRFIRMSTWTLPNSSRLASQCQIPVTAVFQPFADLNPLEDSIPVVYSGSNGPERCARCRSYINAWCQWIHGGNKWKCNLCEHENQVSTEYFCNLDGNMRRLDQDQRSELNKGTVDFIVSEEYWATNRPPPISSPFSSLLPPPSGSRQPQPMKFVFILDVSHHSVETGFLHSACAVLRSVLFDENRIFPVASEVAFITCDGTIQFYDLSKDDPPMLVVADLEDVFLPLQKGMFANPVDRRTVIENLLAAIPLRAADTVSRSSALGSALEGAIASLVGCGGSVVAFQSVMPSVGIGALHGQPNEMELYDSDKEKTLFQPRDPAWRRIADQCSDEGIGVSMFLVPSQFMDIGSIGAVSSVTGGQLFYHPRFEPQKDGAIMESQLRRLVSRRTGYNCMARVRCSNGLRVSSYNGNFCKQSVTDISFGVLDADKAFSACLEHTRTLDTRDFAYVQLAVLYTTVEGERRVRTCNLALPVAELAANVFAGADMDAVASHLARTATAYISSEKLSNIREDVTDGCAGILFGYRQHCAVAVRGSQLIIPERLKGMLAYALAINKTKPLKDRSVSADVRNYYAHRILSMNARALVQHLYPRVMALHDLEDNVAIPDPETGKVWWPSLMQNTYTRMQAHGIYLADNEEVMVLWIGSSVSPQLLLDLFGVEDINQLDPHAGQLPVLDTRFSLQVRNILARRREERGYYLKLWIARQNMDGSEIEFSDMLVEDQNNGTMSYVDCRWRPLPAFTKD
ncbi:vWA-like protein [Fistulina hepatica ATCC 64428]|uniref:VWA-like protein n=1 Tax=Fistulina hepatica ATCC 64428 TaxID=1128425 RepID=A0A0D7AAJ6_9AGAR|nr:vWA-like protein [Fistulina hepatica ATCC 64428]